MPGQVLRQSLGFGAAVGELRFGHRYAFSRLIGDKNSVFGPELAKSVLMAPLRGKLPKVGRTRDAAG